MSARPFIPYSYALELRVSHDPARRLEVALDLLRTAGSAPQAWPPRAADWPAIIAGTEPRSPEAAAILRAAHAEGLLGPTTRS